MAGNLGKRDMPLRSLKLPMEMSESDRTCVGEWGGIV